MHQQLPTPEQKSEVQTINGWTANQIPAQIGIPQEQQLSLFSLIILRVATLITPSFSAPFSFSWRSFVQPAQFKLDFNSRIVDL